MEGLLGFKNYFNKIKREMVLNSYYTKKMKDGKSIEASLLDWIFITILVILFFLITTFNSTKHVIGSIILTIILMTLYLFSLITWKSRTRIKKLDRINEDLGKEEIVKRIDKYNNEDFLLYTKDLLEEYYKTVFFGYDNHIDFIGEINEEIYGVKCIKNSLENLVALKDIEYYIREMNKRKIDEGIIVTNSYFTEEVKEQTNYLLIDFAQIEKMIKETNQFPTKEEIEDIIIKKYKDEKRDFRRKLSDHRKEKTYKFILLGIVLYIISSFVSYPLYYRVMAFILIIIGIIIGVYNIVNYLNKKKELEI